MRSERVVVVVAVAAASACGVDGPLFEAPAATGASALAAGAAQTYVVRDGALFVFGDGVHGDLGLGDEAMRASPVRQPGSWRDVAAGAAFGCALDDGGRALCFGDGAHGQLGVDLPQSSTPVQVPLAGEARRLAAGDDFACALLADGDVECWGGALGRGCAGASAAPATVCGDLRWTQVTAGGDHACAIAEGGALYCWGANDAGQLGTGSAGGALAVPTVVEGGQTWTAVSAGGKTTCAIRSDTTLWCWGDGASGKLGLAPPAQAATPTRLATNDGWAEVSVGGTSVCAVRGDGALFCWGADENGQIGTSDTTTRTTPTEVSPGVAFARVAVGARHACAVERAGAVRCTGDGGSGELGVGDVAGRVVFTVVAVP